MSYESISEEKSVVEQQDREDLMCAKTVLEKSLAGSDELPEKFIQGPGSEYIDHKFRGNWFQGVFSSCGVVVDILRDKEFEQDLANFAAAKRARINQRTTREEIQKGDEFIKRALRMINDAV